MNKQKLEQLKNTFVIDETSEDRRVIIHPDTPEEIKDYLFRGGFEIRDFYYNTAYNAMHDILSNIDDIQDVHEFDIYEWAEADVYTRQLTEWLHENVYNVYYLSEVLDEYEPRDGFELLSLAQYKAKCEVYELILGLVKEYLNIEN